MTDPGFSSSKTMLGVNPRELHSWRSAECGGACERVYKADDVDAEIERLREALERIDAHLEVRPDSELGQLQVISHNHSFGFWLALKAAREVLRNERKPFETNERPMTLGRLLLDTARGTVKERTVTGKELAEIRANMARYFKGPLHFREPLDESGAPYIYDANGNAVAMLIWPGHPVEETAAAEQATYALGHAMAAVVDGDAVKANEPLPISATEVGRDAYLEAWDTLPQAEQDEWTKRGLGQ